MPILEARNLKKYFPVDRGIIFPKIVGHVRAVDGISFSVEEGQTLGIVGESGSGKTTLGLLVMRLLRLTSGDILYRGESITDLEGEKKRLFRRKAQIVFQDPFSSLNPRMIIRDIIGRALKVQGIVDRQEIVDRVRKVLQEVGLREEHLSRYPHEFSGGQRQRIAVARALVTNPDFILLDEPTSALDVSVQAQILNMLKKLQKEKNLTYLFITHDLSVVKHMSHQVLVVYLGRAMEYAQKREIFSEPLHPYTRALLKSIPKPAVTGESIAEKVIKGDIPSPMEMPSGCRFHTRCPLADDECRQKEPAWREIRTGHFVACHKV
ncbi:MAG: ABC transporter ATP-binding protein [Thermovirgaceae bacterium]|jgi:oligopeptide/dipeptide ABC transporter ATP-binding protein